jgi:hypothetical protein
MPFGYAYTNTHTETYMPKESPSHRSNGILLQALPRVRRLVDVAAYSAPLSYKTEPLWYGTCYTYIHTYIHIYMHTYTRAW